MRLRNMPKYDRQFHLETQRLNEAAANEVLPILFELIAIRSTVDVGCGVGAWLKSAQGFGSKTVLGLEGTWLDSDLKVVDEQLIKAQDLEERIKLDSKFDLAISLEVAEHLSQKRADSFVYDLCALSDLVLFSAAIPLQGGEHHVNEQWQSYWAQRFQRQGYRAYDSVRWKIWSRDDIPFWYRQNTVVYCRAESAADMATRNLAPSVTDLHLLDVVHPELYAARSKPRKRNRFWRIGGGFRRSS